MSVQISRIPRREGVKKGTTWLGSLAKALNWIVHVALPLIVLLGSFYLLVLSSMSRFSGLGFVIIVFLGSVGVIIGLFYLIQNIRLMVENKQGRFYFGLGKDIRRISRQEISFLIDQADRSYLAGKNNIRSSLGFTIRNIFTWKEVLILAIVGAFAGYILPLSSTWSILGGALIGVFASHPISVIYAFFCSYMHRYKYRSEFVRTYLEDEQFHKQITEQSNQTASKSNFLASLDYVWGSLSLKVPVCAGLLVFAMKKVPVIILGLFISLAVLPLIGLTVASISIFQLFAYLFGSLGWAPGFQYCLQGMYIFAEWNLPHTVSDFVTLAIVAFCLVVLDIPYQVQRCRLKYRTYTEVARESFKGFWIGPFYLWIIYVVISVLIRCGEILIQHI